MSLDENKTSDGLELQQALDKAAFEYATKNDALPRIRHLAEYAKLSYSRHWTKIRKYIKKKKNDGNWTVIKLKALVIEIKPSKPEEKEDPDSSSFIAIREEIRSLSDGGKRFFDAVDTMMVSKKGSDSPFFTLASYHGLPGKEYCDHRKESFPGWHRIYLMKFEQALQQADKDNGNDGKIALPYWDWTFKPEDGIPAIIRKRFTKLPDNFWSKEHKQMYNNFAKNNGIKLVNDTWEITRDSDKNIYNKMVGNGTVNKAFDCLNSTYHAHHASLGGSQRSGNTSLESPHNDIHWMVGSIENKSVGQLIYAEWAAFDITFWLHHCNVDRIYQTYLQIEKDSAQEFENEQEGNQTDLFDEPFEPFKKVNGEYYYPKDTFSDTDLGFKYDELLKRKPLQLREKPTIVVFNDVKAVEFGGSCPLIHVYILDKDKVDEFKEPVEASDVDYNSDNYGGVAFIFAKGPTCDSCRRGPPVTLTIDITQTLRKLVLSRHNAVIKTYVQMKCKLIKFADSVLPEPEIRGPLFEDLVKESLDEKQDELGVNNVNEVKSAQAFLKRFGYLDGDQAINGIYDGTTVKAVKDYQRASGLTIDGIIGPKTKKFIVESRRCSNKDGFADNNAKDEEIGNKYNKTEINYFIDTHPGYLKRHKVEQTIASAFKAWSNALNNKISFKMMDMNDDNNDIILRWNDGKSIDGAGGVLGHGGQGFVDFDCSERWICDLNDDDQKELSVLSDINTWSDCGKPTVSLFYVALHEIGHALGLDHSASLDDVMGPYYSPELRNLSNNDKTKIKKLYDVKQNKL